MALQQVKFRLPRRRDLPAIIQSCFYDDIDHSSSYFCVLINTCKLGENAHLIKLNSGIFSRALLYKSFYSVSHTLEAEMNWKTLVQE